MGAAACRAVDRAGDLQLVLAVDKGWSTDELRSSGAKVAIDLTVPDVTESNVHAAIDLGVHAVVGTSGWTEESLTRVRSHLDQVPGVGVLVAPNFALGAVLAMVLAAQVAPYFESVEVVEMHHPDKIDAPSGTARATASAIAAARSRAGLGQIPDATATALDGARGADVDGVPVHAVRLRGLVAHEEILFGNQGEQLTIRHDSLDRASFMPGVLLGVRKVADHPGLTVGLEKYLNLEG